MQKCELKEDNVFFIKKKMCAVKLTLFNCVLVRGDKHGLTSVDPEKVFT